MMEWHHHASTAASFRRGTGAGASIPVWLLSAWVRRGLTVPMGVPKMWDEGRLKVEPARENTCGEERIRLMPALAQLNTAALCGREQGRAGGHRTWTRGVLSAPCPGKEPGTGSHLSGGDGSRGGWEGAGEWGPAEAGQG